MHVRGNLEGRSRKRYKSSEKTTNERSCGERFGNGSVEEERG